MNKFTLICLLSAGIFKPSLAQKNIQTEMLNLQESNYVHFNKPYYYAGERVWFKAYMLYANPSLRDSLSKILYANLISPSQQNIQTNLYKIEHGVSMGDFHLADTLQSGNYFLCVYTKWMRNYGDSSLMYYPIRIIDKGKIPLSNISRIRKCDYFDNFPDTIATNTTIHFETEIPNLLSYSVAVTDTFQVHPFQENYHLRIQSGFKEDADFQLVNPLERELSVQVNFQTKKNKKLSFSGIRKHTGEILALESNEKGQINYTWAGDVPEDELMLNLDSKADSYLLPNKNIEANFPPIKNINFETKTNLYIAKDTVVKDAIALKEVVVKEKKVEEKFAPLTKLYGKPDAVVKGEDILQAQVDNPLLALQGRVPGVRVFLNGGQLKIDIRGSSSSSFQGIPDPLVLIDGIPFGGDGLNGLAAIPSQSIKRIEVVKRASAIMGSRASAGVINIITNQSGLASNKPNQDTIPTKVFTVPLRGFEQNNPFQSSPTQPFWLANNSINKTSKVKFAFKIQSLSTVYQIELVGILENGNLIKCYKNVVVK